MMAIAVMIMFVIGIKTLLSGDTKDKELASNRYYPCFTGEKWGVINGKGEFVIEPTFEEMITVPDSKNDIFICMQEVNYETESTKFQKQGNINELRPCRSH